MSFKQDALVFIVGGAICLIVKHASKWAGPEVGSIFQLAPGLTVVSMVFVYLSLGSNAVSSSARAGVPNLIPLGLFLIVVSVLVTRFPLWLAMLLSLSVWLSAILWLRSGGMSGLLWYTASILGVFVAYVYSLKRYSILRVAAIGGVIAHEYFAVLTKEGKTRKLRGYMKGPIIILSPGSIRRMTKRKKPLRR